MRVRVEHEGWGLACGFLVAYAGWGLAWGTWISMRVRGLHLDPVAKQHVAGS